MTSTMSSYKMMCLQFLSFVILCSVQASGTSLMFELPDRERFCIMEKFEGPKEYIFQYRVVRGGKNDVDVTVKSPNGKLLHNMKQANKGTFKFETSRGDYTFCFGNEFSSWVHKLVWFDLRPADLSSLAGEAGIVKPFAKTSSETACDNIHEHMTTVVEYQRDYRLKEFVGRHIAEGLHSNVSIWSFGQTFLILLTGLGQAFILKRFFTDKVEDFKIKMDT